MGLSTVDLNDNSFKKRVGDAPTVDGSFEIR